MPEDLRLYGYGDGNDQFWAKVANDGSVTWTNQQREATPMTKEEGQRVHSLAPPNSVMLDIGVKGIQGIE